MTRVTFYKVPYPWQFNHIPEEPYCRAGPYGTLVYTATNSGRTCFWELPFLIGRLRSCYWCLPPHPRWHILTTFPKSYVWSRPHPPPFLWSVCKDLESPWKFCVLLAIPVFSHLVCKLVYTGLSKLSVKCLWATSVSHLGNCPKW